MVIEHVGIIGPIHSEPHQVIQHPLTLDSGYSLGFDVVEVAPDVYLLDRLTLRQLTADAHHVVVKCWSEEQEKLVLSRCLSETNK